MAKILEKNGSLAQRRNTSGLSNGEGEVSAEQLSTREKEIIACMARGLSNKEIADKLCISVNTVATHRRNLVKKLQIHSLAGIVIYAVINGIVDINDLSGNMI